MVYTEIRSLTELINKLNISDIYNFRFLNTREIRLEGIRGLEGVNVKEYGDISTYDNKHINIIKRKLRLGLNDDDLEVHKFRLNYKNININIRLLHDKRRKIYIPYPKNYNVDLNVFHVDRFEITLSIKLNEYCNYPYCIEDFFEPAVDKTNI